MSVGEMSVTHFRRIVCRRNVLAPLLSICNDMHAQIHMHCMYISRRPWVPACTTAFPILYLVQMARSPSHSVEIDVGGADKCSMKKDLPTDNQRVKFYTHSKLVSELIWH